MIGGFFKLLNDEKLQKEMSQNSLKLYDREFSYNKVYGENGWKAPTVISNAIGQGEVLTTPIQMANFASAIANRGFYIQPHFMKSISEEVQLNLHEKKKTTIDSAHFETIIDGMHKVVEYGTARIARIKGIEV